MKHLHYVKRKRRKWPCIICVLCEQKVLHFQIWNLLLNLLETMSMPVLLWHMKLIK